MLRLIVCIHDHANLSANLTTREISLALTFQSISKLGLLNEPGF
jgi:hypothetical protein